MAAAVAQHTETGEPFVRGAGCSPLFLCSYGFSPFLFLGKPQEGKWGIRKRERNGSNS